MERLYDLCCDLCLKGYFEEFGGKLKHGNDEIDICTECMDKILKERERNKL